MRPRFVLLAAAALMLSGCTYKGRPFIEPAGPGDPPVQLSAPPPGAAAMAGPEGF